MKRKSVELDVDFIGGGRPLTKEDEILISNFIRAQKAKRARKHSPLKRTIGAAKKSDRIIVFSRAIHWTE